MSYDAYSTWKGWDEAGFGRPNPTEEAFYQEEIGRLLDRLDYRAAVLEIGFGNGAFLGWAKAQQYKVYGSELQEELRLRARTLSIPIVQVPSDLPASTLDAVVALDVFEHIEYSELVRLCREIFSRLRPGGYLFARFPNADSPFGLVLQNGDQTHINALGQGKVSDLMRLSGFTKYELRAPQEVAANIRGGISIKIKDMLRWAFTTYVRIAFLGGSTPRTFAMNYLLVAQKPIEPGEQGRAPATDR